jgi:putative membrane-bound dehydrogenase-like protein
LDDGAQAAVRMKVLLSVSVLVLGARLGAAPAESVDSALLLSVSPAFTGPWQAQLVPAARPLLTATSLYYRCFIRVPDNMTSRASVDLWTDSAMFSFADFPARFTVLLNGQKIAEGDSLPVEPRRRFKIPKAILENKAFNILALRLEGDAARAGLRVAPVLHGYHDELLLEGTWEIHAGEPDAADLRAVPNQPPRAFFTEANFREASTTLAPNAELVRGQRLPPGESLAMMRAPADLAVDLLLHEPQIAQPAHFSFDARGRLWVAQYRQYPYPAGIKMVSRDKYYRSTFDRVPPAPPHHDRGRDIISVHEDTDGDGVFDSHRRVLTGLNMANAVLHGHGGFWVMHTPYLLFYPDADGNDVPDHDPEVRLDGFGLEDTHSIANGLAWGPDGWIYGAQGSTTTSRVRRPGTDAPDAAGVYYESCMVWRYHPDSRAYEIFAEGGGNNFGLEFDGEGRLYSGHNGGETRGWHFVQSGIYLKQGKDPGKFGPPTNPYAFGEQPMMGTTNKITRFSHHFAIAEGTALPSNYFGHLFNVDPLHHNVVVSIRILAGSTFATIDTGLAVESDDPAFRPVFAANAPDGALYIADFYEQYIAHGQNYQGQIDPDSGRLYRLRGKAASLNKDVNLARKTTAELLAALSHPNKWHRQTAVRLLAERRDPASRELLRGMLLGNAGDSARVRGSVARPAAVSAGEVVQADGNRSEKWLLTHAALEALWTLHQAGWLDHATALDAVQHPAASVRAWAIRLVGDQKQLPEAFADKLARLAFTEPDAEVRCQIAATARRLSGRQALPLVTALLRRDADTDDPFIPLLCWFTLESFCDSERAAILEMFDVKIPSRRGGLGARPAFAGPSLWNSNLAKRHILSRLMRRFAGKGTRADLLDCAQLLKAAPSDDHRRLLIAAFEEAFKGRALPPLPDELVTALADAGPTSLLLRIRRGDADAVQEALGLIADTTARVEDRIAHIRVLSEVQQPGAVPLLLKVARNDGDTDLRKAALAALLCYANASIGRDIAAAYVKLSAALKPAAQNLLSSRAAWSMAFLELIESGAVDRASVTADAVARLRQHADESVAILTAKLFPQPVASLRPDTRAAVAKFQAILIGGRGNPYAGEPIFAQRCASCHQLFHKGGSTGPNLTPYQRDDLGTMLPSILDPSAEIREGFVNYLVETKDGRALSGFLADQDAHVVTLRGSDGQDVALRRDQISEMNPTTTSLMPEGLLEGLTEQQVRDFFAYLRIPQPITR